MIRRLYLVGAGALATLLIFEALLRAFPPPISDQFFQPDERFGTFHIAGRHGWSRSSEFSVFVTINSRGLRDVEHDLVKPKGTCRILLLGDSWAEAMQVPYEDTIGAQLEHRLNSLGTRRFEVINGGVSAFGTDRELLFYTIEGRAYLPDLVLLLFFSNDPSDNAHSPYFFLDGGILRQHTSAPLPSQWPPANVRRWMWDHLMSVRLASFTWANLTAPPTADGPGVIYQVPVSPGVEAEWDVTDALLWRLEHAVAADGGSLILVDVPDVHSLEPGSSPPGYALDQVSSRLGEIAQQLAVPFVDLRRTFQAEGDNAASAYYWPIDTHWNAAGHNLAAQVLAQRISSPGIFPAGARHTCGG